MSVVEILEEALQAVQQAKIPGHLEQAAFEFALAHLVASQSPSAKDAGNSNKHYKASSASSQDSNGSIGLIQKLADRLKLEAETVAEVFHEEDGQLKLMVASKKLEPAKRAATQQIALLTCAARQCDSEEWTPAEEIRTVVDYMGKLDPSNFASAFNEMEDQFGFGGTPRKRKLKLKKKGWEEAGTLIESLGGGAP